MKNSETTSSSDVDIRLETLFDLFGKPKGLFFIVCKSLLSVVIDQNTPASKQQSILKILQRLFRDTILEKLDIVS